MLFDKFIIYIYARAYKLSPDRNVKRQNKTVKWYLNKMQKIDVDVCYQWYYVHRDFLNSHLQEPFSYFQIDNLQCKELKDELKYYGLQDLALLYHEFWVKELKLKYIDIFKIAVVIPYLQRWVKSYKIKKYKTIEEYLPPNVAKNVVMPYLMTENDIIIINKMQTLCWQCYIPHCNLPRGQPIESDIINVYWNNMGCGNRDAVFNYLNKHFQWPGDEIKENCQNCNTQISQLMVLHSGKLQYSSISRVHILYDKIKKEYTCYFSSC